jgi:hypothetical protein
LYLYSGLAELLRSRLTSSLWEESFQGSGVDVCFVPVEEISVRGVYIETKIPLQRNNSFLVILSAPRKLARKEMLEGDT